MHLDDYTYELPRELIAQHPAARRDESRMMILDRAREKIEHRRFRDLTDYVAAQDLLVFNDTRVLPARVFGRRAETGGRVELFFLEPSDVRQDEWEVLLRSGRRPAPGQRIRLEGGEASAEFLEDLGRGRARVRLEGVASLVELLQTIGHTPLPPYIQREEDDPEDRDRYQTVYAQTAGAVAAPTAGLHFTDDMLETLRAQGAETAFVTLHVGLGTFQGIETEDPRDHDIGEERYRLPEETAAAWHRTRNQGGRVLAVGSTSVRTLETVAASGNIQPDEGRSELYIYPPYEFRAVDRILTNFHLPKSTLLLMMSAFAGREFLLDAYQQAVVEKYRFYSYGDCMLIL